jgi:hypothetical protein
MVRWLVEAPIGTDLAAAWFGIAGVVVGAITTGLVSYRAERRQERREAELALKLARAEIAEIRKLADTALADLRWPPGMGMKSWAQSWSTNRRSLAGGMDESTFAAVASAYGYADQIQSGLAAGERSFAPPPPGEDRSPDEVFFSHVKQAFETAAEKMDA